MNHAEMLMALAALLIGLSLFGQQETERVIVLRILGILLLVAAAVAWWSP